MLDGTWATKFSNKKYYFFQMPNRILCLYSYYEKNQDYKKNFEYFLENGIDDYVVYKIIINGNCSVQIPSKTNIEVIQRENLGFDFGAYSFFIQNPNNKIILDSFTHFIFINNSVRGPYNKMPWYTDYINMINDKVKLVGTSINILTFFNKKLGDFDFPYPHVQSMMFAMDLEALKFLKDSIFSLDVINMTNKEEVILKKEVLMSLLIMRNGWNINCTLLGYKDIDYINLKHDINPTSFFGDPSYKNRYFGKTFTPKDGAFFLKSDPMRQLLPVQKLEKKEKYIL